MTTTNDTAEIAEIRMEIRIAASASAVWKGLTEDIASWWPEDFYAGGASGARTYQLEARPGGRMCEEWDGGGGAVWGTVVLVDPGRQLQVLGTNFPRWGGPSTWFGTWELAEEGAETVLTFSEATVGRISDSHSVEKDRGWRFLFEGALKAHVEGRPAPAWAS